MGTEVLALTAVAASLATIALCLIMAVRAGDARQELRSLVGRLKALKDELEVAQKRDERAGERLRRLEVAGSAIAERLGQLELRGEGRPYDQAIGYVRRGADAERLMKHFGLSRGEAELLTRVHGRPRATG
jgi:hypothetical protein